MAIVSIKNACSSAYTTTSTFLKKTADTASRLEGRVLQAIPTEVRILSLVALQTTLLTGIYLENRKLVWGSVFTTLLLPNPFPSLRKDRLQLLTYVIAGLFADSICQRKRELSWL